MIACIVESNICELYFVTIHILRTFVLVYIISVMLLDIYFFNI